MFDKERLDPHGVSNLRHILTIKNKSPRLDLEEELSARITHVLPNFQSIS